MTIAGTSPPGPPGGAPPLKFRFRCPSCEVEWTGDGECWVCGRLQKPAVVLEVAKRR